MSDEKKWRIVCNLEFGYTAADILTLRRSQISRHLLGPLRNSFLKEQEPTSSGTHICGIIIIQLKKSHQLYPIQENQMQAPQTEQEKKATLANEKSCRCPVFRIVFFTVLLIGAVSGLSLVFTGSSNPLDYFVPVDPPGEAEAYRWDAESGLELMVEVRQHIQKKIRSSVCTHLTNCTFSRCVPAIFRMHVIQAGRRLLTNQLRTGM